ncbi:MAG: hypothetical protein QXG39_02835 [Candidatus Aenigmatarchaeota archaeon]
MSKFHKVFGAILKLNGIAGDPIQILKELFTLVRALPESTEWKHVRKSGEKPQLEEQLRLEMVTLVGKRYPEYRQIVQAYLRAVELAKQNKNRMKLSEKLDAESRNALQKLK